MRTLKPTGIKHWGPVAAASAEARTSQRTSSATISTGAVSGFGADAALEGRGSAGMPIASQPPSVRSTGSSLTCPAHAAQSYCRRNFRHCMPTLHNRFCCPGSRGQTGGQNRGQAYHSHAHGAGHQTAALAQFCTPFSILEAPPIQAESPSLHCPHICQAMQELYTTVTSGHDHFMTGGMEYVTG